MTTGTVRLIGRRTPGNSLTVGPMAFSTGQISPVITRIASATVTEIRWRPTVRGVALIALQTGHKMVRRLACGGGSIMASIA